MIQILLIIIGLLVLVKGKLKVSDTKEITRPQSIYWGLVLIGYGIASSFIPTTKLIYSLIFYISLVVVSAIFISKGKTIASDGVVVKSSNTKRNVIILLIFVAILITAFYLFYKMT